MHRSDVPMLLIGEVLARMRGAQLRDVKLLHRSGLRSFHREFLERPPGEASGTVIDSLLLLLLWLL